MSVCMSRYSRFSSASLDNTAASLKLMSRCCSSSVSGISSLPPGVRSLNLKRIRSWNSRTWPEALRPTTTFSRWSCVTSITTSARSSGTTVTLPPEAMLRLSSLPRVEESAEPMAMVLKTKSGALRSWKPQAASSKGAATSRARRCIRSPRSRAGPAPRSPSWRKPRPSAAGRPRWPPPASRSRSCWRRPARGPIRAACR